MVEGEQATEENALSYSHTLRRVRCLRAVIMCDKSDVAVVLSSRERLFNPPGKQHHQSGFCTGHEHLAMKPSPFMDLSLALDGFFWLLWQLLINFVQSSTAFNYAGTTMSCDHQISDQPSIWLVQILASRARVAELQSGPWDASVHVFLGGCHRSERTLASELCFVC